MKKVLMVIALSLLLSGCGEVVAPAATPTPTLGNGTCNPAPCSQEGTTPAPETPTATATPQAVTHGRPQIGGLFSDFYGKYGTPHNQGNGNSESWFVSEQPSIAINATPNDAGRVTHISVTELDLNTGDAWDITRMMGYCSQFLPDDAAEAPNRITDTGQLWIDYNSSIGQIVELLTSGTCTISSVGS